jgi:hypothetical protein
MDELEIIDDSSLDRFMSRWYGITRQRLDVDDLGTPPPIAAWFELTRAGAEHVSQYYRVRSPDRLAIVDGLLVFCDDPAGEFVWACGRQDPDPPTFERMNDESRWRDTGFRLSSIMLYIAVAGAVLAARTGLGHTNISPEDFGRRLVISTDSRTDCGRGRTRSSLTTPVTRCWHSGGTAAIRQDGN